MLTIDGSFGEGGGQIVRSSLALAAATGTPVTIEHVRAGRRKPGLLRQHRVAVEALTRLCAAHVQGAELGSTRLVFEPGPISAGEHHFSIGSAGSTLLVLQAALPVMLRAPGPCTLVLEGGTHNPFAPPFDFVARVLAPLLGTAGADVALTLERHGFYPAGGGRIVVRVRPALAPRPIVLEERAPLGPVRGRVLLSGLAERIARRERDTLASLLRIPPSAVHLERVDGSPGPGNVVLVEHPFEDRAAPGLAELGASFGERGRSAEAVATAAAEAALRFRASTAPVAEHLADQLLVPLALLAGGRFRTCTPSLHTRTNAAVVERFLPGCVRLEQEGPEVHVVEVSGP